MHGFLMNKVMDANTIKKIKKKQRNMTWQYQAPKDSKIVDKSEAETF
jgi:hypothetical protein